MPAPVEIIDNEAEKLNVGDVVNKDRELVLIGVVSKNENGEIG